MIGALRHRLVLEEKIQTPDEGGGFLESWVERATVWAALSPLGGAESLSADQTVARARVRLRIRHRADVTPALRARLGTRLFALTAVSDPDGRSRWLDLDALENAPS